MSSRFLASWIAAILITSVIPFSTSVAMAVLVAVVRSMRSWLIKVVIVANPSAIVAMGIFVVRSRLSRITVAGPSVVVTAVIVSISAPVPIVA